MTDGSSSPAAGAVEQTALAAAAQTNPDYKTLGGQKTTEVKTKPENSTPIASIASLEDGRKPKEIPLSDLPPLPQRSILYYTQPFFGAFIVIGLSILLQVITPGGYQSRLVLCFFSCIAFGCVGVLLFADSGAIERTSETVHPIPEEVISLLDTPNELKFLTANLKGPVGGPGHMGSFCVRCLVWRPKTVSKGDAGEFTYRGEVHHCQVCQRCYTGFDHHCGVFGRCIVQKNLLYFYLLVAMLPAGLATFLVPAILYSNTVPSQP
eukprot:TRINITY_DN72775_c0_g1_i1.p1 TRINITY_DN72775_c0_g1~~TRINITY_DN72775_c0_g1_i1.p1  ORF type:complete len:265 (-),score=46.02 TRINITY_DN72775_c0_g1_i1:113-907(-)